MQNPFTRKYQSNNYLRNNRLPVAQYLAFGLLTVTALISIELIRSANPIGSSFEFVSTVQYPAKSSTDSRSRAYEFGVPIVEREHWNAEQFFKSPETLAICAAISAHDDTALKKFTTTPGNNLNATGENRFTLLHWAYAEHNLIGFRLLLEAGASPDMQIKGIIRSTKSQPFFNGDSVLFTTLRHRRYDFFLAAFKYSENVNQRDARGDLLIHTMFQPDEPSNFERFGITQESMLSVLIQSKMILDEPNHLGSMPSHLTVQNKRALLCLMLLESGVDKNLTNKRGQTVRDIVDKHIGAFQNWKGKGMPQDGFLELMDWLDRHDPEVSGPEQSPSEVAIPNCY